jgi:large subunit ribosomal protein L13e
MVTKNNEIQSTHLRKHRSPTPSNKGFVKTFFNQAGHKPRRQSVIVESCFFFLLISAIRYFSISFHLATLALIFVMLLPRLRRGKKRKRIFPRPVDGAFRPVVHCATQRYNMKVRESRGYSPAELKVLPAQLFFSVFILCSRFFLQKAKISQVLAKHLAISIDHRRLTERMQNINRLKAYRARVVITPKDADLVQLVVPAVLNTDATQRVAAIPKPELKTPKAKKSKKPKVQPETSEPPAQAAGKKKKLLSSEYFRLRQSQLQSEMLAQRQRKWGVVGGYADSTRVRERGRRIDTERIVMKRGMMLHREVRGTDE